MKKYLLPLILILFLTFTLIGDCADWLAGWDYRIELSIGDYAGDIGASVTWFPVTVFLTGSQAEEVFAELTDEEYNLMQFTEADGTTKLYGEKELFDTEGYYSQYPPVQNDTYVKATTYFAGGHYLPHFTTNPTLSLTGVFEWNAWLAAEGEVTDQRFHIDLGSAKIIKRIYYENQHNNGSLTDSGVQNFTFWGSNTEASFLELTYGTNTGWTILTVDNENKFDRHADPSDAPDPKYINVDNDVAYRYYAFKFADNYGEVNLLGVRRIELQTLSEAIYHVSRDGWTINSNTSVFLYYDKDHAPNTDWIGEIGSETGEKVWNDEFKVVYHMADNDGGNVTDSTHYDNDGTKKDTNEPIEAVGKVGLAQYFAGDDDYIYKNSPTGLPTGTGARTVECWINPDSIPVSGWKFMVFWGVTGTVSHTMAFGISSVWDEWGVTQWGSTISGGTPEIGIMKYIAFTYDSSDNYRLYENGSEVATGSMTTDTQSGNLNIGRIETDSYIHGILDEVRISSVNRGAVWLRGTSNSLLDTLFIYGSREEAPEVVEVNAIFFGMNF